MGQPDAERRSLTRKGSVAAGRAAAVPGVRPEAGIKGRAKIRKRRRAVSMTRAMVVFIAILSAVVVVSCISYLREREFLTRQVKQNEKLASSLTTLKSENDALYESVTGSIDWEKVRDLAVNKLGMKYAADDQIIWYNTEGSSYIRQYHTIP